MAYTQSDYDGQFAAEVSRKLLQRIASMNQKSDLVQYAVTHAWTDGPMLFVVYTAPPSDRTWGPARDTRQSIVDPGPWQPRDDPAQYYYLIDFEENQPSSSMRQLGEFDTIWWFDFPATVCQGSRRNSGGAPVCATRKPEVLPSWRPGPAKRRAPPIRESALGLHGQMPVMTMVGDTEDERHHERELVRTSMSRCESKPNYAFIWDEAGFEGTAGRIRGEQNAGDVKGMVAQITNGHIATSATESTCDGLSGALAVKYGE